MMKVWRYVVRYDDGLAPCVEKNFCTLTCCKPLIRKHAEKNDWIIGFHSRKFGDAMLCYVMRITEEPIKYQCYWHDKRFAKRRDNIYQPIDDKLIWVPNEYRDHDDVDNHSTDQSGFNALVSNEYWYFNKGETFSLYDYLEEGIASRLWHRHVGQKYNGLLDGDFDSLLRFLEQNYSNRLFKLPTATTRLKC